MKRNQKQLIHPRIPEKERAVYPAVKCAWVMIDDGKRMVGAFEGGGI